MALFGVLKQKGESTVTILRDGVETEYEVTSQVAEFIPRFKEGIEVEFSVKTEEVKEGDTVTTKEVITFMKKVYQSYKSTPAKPSAEAKPSEVKPVWKPDVPLHPESVKSLEGKVKVEEPEKKPAHEKKDPSPEKPKEPEMTKITPEMVKPAIERQFTTTLGEKDFKIALMSSIKAASSIMECALTAAPEFLQIDKEKMSLDDLIKEITQRTLKIAEDVDDWMDQRYSTKK